MIKEPWTSSSRMGRGGVGGRFDAEALREGFYAGAGCLIVYEDSAADTTYPQALETLDNMGRVVDALYDKAQKLGVTSQSQSVAAPKA